MPRSKKTLKLRFTGLCKGNSSVTGKFPAQMIRAQKMFPFDDVIIQAIRCSLCLSLSPKSMWVAYRKVCIDIISNTANYCVCILVIFFYHLVGNERRQNIGYFYDIFELFFHYYDGVEIDTSYPISHCSFTSQRGHSQLNGVAFATLDLSFSFHNWWLYQGICSYSNTILVPRCFIIRSLHWKHWVTTPRQNHFADDILNAFSWMKMYEFSLGFHWRLFLRFHLTIFQHWFRSYFGADQATSHYLNQWWLIGWCIYASFGLNELIF